MRIAHFGTFDVDNYGDLLFPHVAEWRWPEVEWVHVSPTPKLPTFEGAKPSISLSSVAGQRFDAVVVGGGNIVHLARTPLAEYRDVARIAYPALWLGSYRAAAERRVPYVVNGPSVSHAPPYLAERIALRAVVRRAAYAAFRDEHSVRAVGHAELVPDTAFDVARMWPLGKSSNAEGWLGVHLNVRYAPSLAASAAAIDRLARRTGLRVRLIAIGPVHGDVDLARRVSALMAEPATVVASVSVRSMAHAIGSCTAYVGSSMHGFITALAYGRTAALVLGGTPMQKFHGVLAAAGLPPQAIHRSWEHATDAPTLAFAMPDASDRAIRDALDRHWDRVRTAAGSGTPAERFPLLGWWRLAAGFAQVEDLGRRAGARLARRRPRA
jgi:hypothetical protein